MTSLKYPVILAVMLSSATGCAMAADSLMSGSDIKARVIGNTVAGVDEGKPYQEYYNPNGSIDGVDTEEYGGAWRIDSNRLCTRYESDDEKKGAPAWECSGVTVKGDQLTWVDGEGEKTEVKLLAGKQLKQPAP